MLQNKSTVDFVKKKKKKKTSNDGIVKIDFALDYMQKIAEHPIYSNRSKITFNSTGALLH